MPVVDPRRHARRCSIGRGLRDRPRGGSGRRHIGRQRDVPFTRNLGVGAILAALPAATSSVVGGPIRSFVRVYGSSNFLSSMRSGDTVPGPAAQRDLPFALTRRFTIVGLRVNGLRILTVPISKISE